MSRLEPQRAVLASDRVPEPEPAKEPRAPAKEAPWSLEHEEQKSLVLLTLLCVTLLLGPGLYLLFHEEETVQTQADLRIDHVFTKLVEEDTLTYTLDLKVLLTNVALQAARSVRIEIAGIDNTAQLTYDVANASGLEIPAQNTTEVSIRLTLPKVTAHRIFVMVFQEEELKLKGSSIISVTGSVSRRDFRVTYQRGVEPQATRNHSDLFWALSFLFGLLVLLELVAVLAALQSSHLRSALVKLTEARHRR